MMLLRDKTAIVYGASGAVGGAVAKAFAREGARVFLAARNQERLEAVAASIRASGGTAEVAPIDATDQTAVETHLADIAGRAGPVKLMFNAIEWGTTATGPLTESEFEPVLRPVRTALSTWFYTGTAAARHMSRNGGGTIVGLVAYVGHRPGANNSGFGIACAAVEHYLSQLAVENGRHGVRVTWVRSPGSPDAPGVRYSWERISRERGISVEELHAEIAKDVPLGRVTALAQVADAAVLLASDLAAGMTMTMANATGGAYVD